MKNNNGVWVAVAVIVVVLAIIFAVMHKKAPATVSDTTSSTTTPSDTTTPPADSVPDTDASSSATIGVAPVTMSYQNALVTYKDARIQFNDMCQANPTNVTYKTGTYIMLDNRSATARTIHLGSLGSVSVKGYGFKIVQLSLTGLNMNSIAVDCDSQQNTAIITVQK